MLYLQTVNLHSSEDLQKMQATSFIFFFQKLFIISLNLMYNMAKVKNIVYLQNLIKNFSKNDNFKTSHKTALYYLLTLP